MAMIEIGSDGVAHDATWHRGKGFRALYEARMSVRLSKVRPAKGEQLYREAISHLVEAFLHDRVGQADCFGHAHRAGAEVNDLVGGCRYEYEQASDEYRLDCPVFALHAYVGTSIAWSWTVACSVCGAGQFECDHVPGETYADQVCQYENRGFTKLDHVALTPNPAFIYTWHWPKQHSASRLVRDELPARAER